MKTILAFLIIGFSCIFVLALHKLIPPAIGKPGIFRRIWRGIVHVWDFITGFG